VLALALSLRKVDRRIVITFSIFAVITLALYPVITRYREIRALTKGGLSADVLQQAVSSATEESGWVGVAGFQVVQRFMGVDILLFLTEPSSRLSPGQYLSTTERWGSLSKYFTHAIMGVPETAIFSEAASLVGWFLMFAGMTGVVLLFPLFLTVLWYTWRKLCAAPLLVRTAAQVHFLLTWIILSSEGTFETMTLQIIAVIASIAGVEFYLRRFAQATPVPATIETGAV
jgi:hypothetical protein